MSKILQINRVLQEYFEFNKTVKNVLAKDMMPYFVLAGVFEKDSKNGLPIRNVLARLNKNGKLNKIPYAVAKKKNVYISWYFQPAPKYIKRKSN